MKNTRFSQKKKQKTFSRLSLMPLPRDFQWIIDKSLTILFVLVEKEIIKNDYDLREKKIACD